jgi:hypothetical protein
MSLNKSTEDSPWSSSFPPAWEEALSSSAFLDMMFRGHSILMIDDQISHRSRQCLVQLSAVSSKTFMNVSNNLTFAGTFVSNLSSLMSMYLLFLLTL